MKVFIILHHEIMGPFNNYRDDIMHFYTASSLKKALQMIKECHVARWSWWEIQVQELDEHEDPVRIGFYGRRGGKLTKEPYKKCIEIFKKERPKNWRPQKSLLSNIT